MYILYWQATYTTKQCVAWLERKKKEGKLRPSPPEVPIVCIGGAMGYVTDSYALTAAMTMPCYQMAMVAATACTLEALGELNTVTMNALVSTRVCIHSCSV
jgi:hypothetical protein